MNRTVSVQQEHMEERCRHSGEEVVEESAPPAVIEIFAVSQDPSDRSQAETDDDSDYHVDRRRHGAARDFENKKHRTTATTGLIQQEDNTSNKHALNKLQAQDDNSTTVSTADIEFSEDEDESSIAASSISAGFLNDEEEEQGVGDNDASLLFGEILVRSPSHVLPLRTRSLNDIDFDLSFEEERFNASSLELSQSQSSSVLTPPKKPLRADSPVQPRTRPTAKFSKSTGDLSLNDIPILFSPKRVPPKPTKAFYRRRKAEEKQMGALSEEAFAASMADLFEGKAMIL